MSRSSNSLRRPNLLRAVAVLAVVAAGYWLMREPEPGNRPATVPTIPATERKAAPRQDADADALQSAPAINEDALQVSQVVVRDLEGRVVYRGTVDLTETLQRIEQRRRLEYHNDGSTFANREGRLPGKPAGYYKEYVHPTPGLAGPGPQRIVVGAEGEAYYTPDHYRTFKKLR